MFFSQSWLHKLPWTISCLCLSLSHRSDAANCAEAGFPACPCADRERLKQNFNSATGSWDAEWCLLCMDSWINFNTL